MSDLDYWQQSAKHWPVIEKYCASGMSVIQ